MSQPKERPANKPASDRAFPRVLVAAALILLAGLIVYTNSFHGEFSFDDKEAIRDNLTIRKLWPLKDVLFPASHVNTVDGRPLLNLSFALNYAVHGLDVRGYHAVNLAVHLLAGLALFGIVRRTLLLPAHRERMQRASWGLALVVALLWVIHPLQTESVTGICQRAESLMGLFYLLTFYLAIRGFDSDRPQLWLAAAAGMCLMGTATKEVMATAPPLLLLYDRLFVAGSLKLALRKRWGFYLALVLSWGELAALLTKNAGWGLANVTALFSQLGGQGQSAVAGTSSSWVAYALTQFVAVTHYVRLSIWPSPLILDYGNEVVKGASEVVMPALFVGLLLLGTLVAFRRFRWVGFAGAWFFLILAPTSSVMPLPGQTIAEHRMYLSLAAIVVLLVIGGYESWRRLLPNLAKQTRTRELLAWRVPAMVATVVLAILGGLTLARNTDYRTEYSIMLDTVRKRPTNPRAHNNLGYALAERGDVDQATQHYERALELKPDYADAHNNPGTQLSTQGKLDAAIQHFEQALQVRPDYVNAHNNLGGALARQGKLPEAIPHFERATQLDPHNAIAHSNLGNALTAQGNVSEAIRHYESALQIQPDYPEAHSNLGEALTKQGRINEAIQHFQQALNLAVAQGKPALAEHSSQWINYCRSISAPGTR